MNNYIQLLFFVIIGIFLLWLGYFLVTRYVITKSKSPSEKAGREIKHEQKTGSYKKDKNTYETSEGFSKTCPICSSKLDPEEQVKTTAFPALNNSKDRMMHIHGCPYCITGMRKRSCPVCGEILGTDEFLAARIFERALRRSHVHVLGCPHCRKM